MGANMAIIVAILAVLAVLAIMVLRCPLLRTLSLAIDAWADETQGQLNQLR